jgi:hypothetical protein
VLNGVVPGVKNASAASGVRGVALSLLTRPMTGDWSLVLGPPPSVDWGAGGLTGMEEARIAASLAGLVAERRLGAPGGDARVMKSKAASRVDSRLADACAAVV